MKYVHHFSWIFLSLVLFGCSVDENSKEYQEAKRNLERQGIIQSESDIEQETTYRKLLLGSWYLDSLIGSSVGNAYFSKSYKNEDDYVSITEFQDDGRMIVTTISDYQKKNTIEGKSVSEYKYRVNENGIYVQSFWGKNNEKVSQSFFPIIILTESRFAHTLENGDEIETHYYSRKVKSN